MTNKPLENFSEFDNIFCDSKEVLFWAYDNGLPKDALIKTSAPALLWDKNPNIQNIESRWSEKEMRKFTSEIKTFSEKIYDYAISIKNVTREEALCAAQFSFQFQNTLFKAACLKEEDFYKKSLFLKVEGVAGPSGNQMNSPWDKFLSNNPNFTTYTYSIKNQPKAKSSIKKTHISKRIQIAGIETVLYRIILKLTKNIPSFFFRNEVLIPSENELIIETASSLMLRGSKVKQVSPSKLFENQIKYKDRQNLIEEVLPILRERTSQWLVHQCEKACEDLYVKELKEHFKLFDRSLIGWRSLLSNKSNKKSVVLINSSGNFIGQSLAALCKEKKIPIISAQHGVTAEISELHDECGVVYNSTIADTSLLYNHKAAEAESKIHFTKSNSLVVGMSTRHIRMNNKNNTYSKSSPPLVYISTNLYKGNIGGFLSFHTDYKRAKNEQKLLKEVFIKLPHRVCYKTYPEENKRYADTDPVIQDVRDEKNIEVFDEKIDMRYLLSDYQVIITSSATSTLGWPVMSGKPVIFINQQNNGPLSSEAKSSLSKGLFVFNDEDVDFYDNLRLFLSQPIEEIENQWRLKKTSRDKMIEEFFSSYGFEKNAGKRAADEIMKHYLN